MDENSKKITTLNTINLDENIVDFYPSLTNKSLVFTQTFNTSTNKYKMNLLKYNFQEGKLEENESLLKDDKTSSIYE